MTKTELNKHRLDKKEIPSDPSAYIFRDSQRNGTWCLYFYDREAKSRHRIVLKDGNGSKPIQSIEGQNDAWMLASLNTSSSRGKQIEEKQYDQ